ncbi:MAG: FAD-dependent oxidoreductase [Rikenellaceae bacterium]
MDRKKFLTLCGLTTLTVSTPLLSHAMFIDKKEFGVKGLKGWKYLGDKETKSISREKYKEFAVAILGGGFAGISAAVAAARHGAKTVLIQNRPVLGGNASSEIRVIVNGAYRFKNKFGVDRETGIIEEILLANRYYNPQRSWSVWDHVIYDYVTSEPNLTLLLNTQATEAVMDGNRIKRAICYQSTTESKINIDAKLFVDCSGDGQLAANAGAEYRTGRESKAEFGEIYAPEKADGWVMGDTILFHTKNCGASIDFTPPSFAIKYDPSKMNKRAITTLECGYWWVELGSNLDIIDISEDNRHKLLAYAYGAWDYIKNSGKFPQAAPMALDWVGSIPGRRESRRFMGDYMLTERDFTLYRKFEDTIAFSGGWSLDEHCPGGILNSEDPASFFHCHFERMTEVPFRSLYSKNIDNLLFAGRNASVSHIALSSTRIIGTCALMGQAAGTAAAMCVEYSTTPRGIYQNHIHELQERLIRDDSYLPYRPASGENDLARKATLEASSTLSGDVLNLIDGYGRDELDAIHHWESEGLNPDLTLKWREEIDLSKVEIKCDSNLHKEIQLEDPYKMKLSDGKMPKELAKKISVEIFKDGQWVEIANIDNNIRRLVKFTFPKVKTTALRVNVEETYGASNVRLFEVRCY